MTTTSQTQSCALPERRARRSILSFIMKYIALARQRHALRELDPHLLKDIGVSTLDAEKECTKPLWDVPDHWRQ